MSIRHNQGMFRPRRHDNLPSIRAVYQRHVASCAPDVRSKGEKGHVWRYQLRDISSQHSGIDWV